MTKQTNKLQKKITILGCLANESTGKSRKLLKKHGKADATDHRDLEMKLSQLYKETDDKKALEKEFAEIHPHRDFILKHCAPKPEPVAVETKEVEIVVAEPVKEVEPNFSLMPEQKSNCAGVGGCSCGCSGFDGATNSVSNNSANSTATNDRLIILGMFGFVSILALVLITKK